MTISATKRMEFDAAHRVAGHAGKCKTLHGHRYAVEVSFTRTDGLMVDDAGFVIDFGVIKERLGKWIDDNLDHTTLYDAGDKYMVAMRELSDAMEKDAPELTRGELRKWYPMDSPPTAENLCILLAKQAQALLPRGVTVLRLRVYETPTSYAELDNEARLTARSLQTMRDGVR